MHFNRIGELRIDSDRFSSLLSLSYVHRLGELVHIFVWQLHNSAQNLHNLLIVLGLWGARQRASTGKTSETRCRLGFPQGVKRYFLGARYAGGKSPTYR